ncbi:glycosyltransferase 87 family protein [Dactylosporangium sp. NPDC049525]|uniref:glycosyltransferase 87 family protein n=1 Tax=Dactylosporangium sp. NPDC049525 TaxID=3154730 RepID=UPI00341F4689
MSDDPPLTPFARHPFLARPPAWLAPAGFAALAVSTVVLFLVFSRYKLFTGMDALVYRHGADDLWHGRTLYAFTPGVLPFTYPPMAAVAFLPMLLVPPYVAAKALAAASLAGLYLVIWIGLGMIGVPRGGGRAGLAAALTAAALWLEPVVSDLEFGQINLLILPLVIADLATPNRRWHKGIGIGLAAAVKLTPALFVVYLLATRRWRAAAVATATFLAAAAVGLLADPHDSTGFWSDLGSSDRVRDATPLWYVGDQSLHGLLLRAVHGAQSADRAWLVAAAVTVVATLWLATRASRTGNELLAAVLVFLGAVLVSPVSWTHHWVFVALLPVLLLDVALNRRTHPWPVLPAALLILVFLNWPSSATAHFDHNPWGLVFLDPHFDAVPSQGPQPELHWTWPQHLLGESYTLAALVLLTMFAFLASRTPPPTAPGDPRFSTAVVPSGGR